MPRSAGNKRGGVADLLTQLLRPGVGLFHLRSRRALGGHQRRPQGELHLELLLHPRRSLRQGGQEGEPAPEPVAGLLTGIASQGIVCGLLHILHRPGVSWPRSKCTASSAACAPACAP